MPVYDFWVTVNSLEIGGARVGVKILSCGDPGGFVAAGAQKHMGLLFVLPPATRIANVQLHGGSTSIILPTPGPNSPYLHLTYTVTGFEFNVYLLEIELKAAVTVGIL